MSPGGFPMGILKETNFFFLARDAVVGEALVYVWPRTMGSGGTPGLLGPWLLRLDRGLSNQISSVLAFLNPCWKLNQSESCS
jgi:hypothetical protein